MSENLVFEDLEFLLDTAPSDNRNDQRNGPPNAPTSCQAAKTKRRRLAERIAENDELVRQIKQLEDLKRTASQVTELYQREKEQRSELATRLTEQSERCADLEKQLDVTQLNCEQLQSELDTKGLPVDAKEMICVFLQLTQRLKDDSSHPSSLMRRETNLARKLKDYCKSANIIIPPPPIKSPSNKRTKTTTTTAFAATQTESQTTQAVQPAEAQPELPKMCSIGVQNENLKSTRDQGTQHINTTTTRGTTTASLIEMPLRSTRDQGTQHKNTTTTRGTTTASFIKMHDVSTCFPEPKPPLSAYQILDKMLSWNKTFITPLSPIRDDTPPATETTSIGTCTFLCNVQREIDYLPDLPAQLKRSDSRPPSRGSVKDEKSNPMSSYGQHMAKELLNFLPQNQSILANLPPHVFEEIWQVMGQMVLVVLQRRSSNSSLLTPAPTISQADFSSWFDALYESSLNQTQSSKGKPRYPTSLAVQLQSNLFKATDFDASATGVDVGTDTILDAPASPPTISQELTPIRLPITPKVRFAYKKKCKKKKRPKRIKHDTTETAVNFLTTLYSFHNPDCDDLDNELNAEELKLLQLTTTATTIGELNSSATVEQLTEVEETVKQLPKSPMRAESDQRVENRTMAGESCEQLTTSPGRVEQPTLFACRELPTKCRVTDEQSATTAGRIGQLTMTRERDKQRTTSELRVENLTMVGESCEQLATPTKRFKQPIKSALRVQHPKSYAVGVVDVLTSETEEQMTTSAGRVEQPTKSAISVEQPMPSAVRDGELPLFGESCEQLETSAKRFKQPTKCALRAIQRRCSEQPTSSTVGDFPLFGESCEQLATSAKRFKQPMKSALRVNQRRSSEQPTSSTIRVGELPLLGMPCEDSVTSANRFKQPKKSPPRVNQRRSSEQPTPSRVTVEDLFGESWEPFTTTETSLEPPTISAPIYEQCTTTVQPETWSSRNIVDKPTKRMGQAESFAMPQLPDSEATAKLVQGDQSIGDTCEDGNESDTDSLHDLIIDYNEDTVPSDTETAVELPEVEQNYHITRPSLSPVMPSVSKRKRKASTSSSDSPQPVVKRLTRLQAKKLQNWAHETQVESSEAAQNSQPNSPDWVSDTKEQASEPVKISRPSNVDSGESPMSPVGAAESDEWDSEPIQIPLDPPGGAQFSSEPMSLLNYVIQDLKKNPPKRGLQMQQPKKEHKAQLHRYIMNFLMNAGPLKPTTLSSTDETLVISTIIQAVEELELDAVEGDVLDRLLSLVKQLESRSCAFIQRFMNTLEKRLFHPKNRLTTKVSQKFVRLYLQLIGVQASLVVPGKQYANPARLLLIKILYHYKEDMPLLVLDVLCRFPTVLPHREERDYDNSDPLITVIKHLLMNTKYDMTDAAGPDRALLSKLRFEYHFQPFEPAPRQVIDNLVEKVKAGRLNQLCYAFALFCRRCQLVSVFKELLNTQLVPLANSYCDLAVQSEEYDERLECLLQCISMIVKQVPLDANYDITPYLSLFKRLLVAVPRARVQEAAVQAILRTQRFGFAFALDALQNYRPNYPLTPMTRAMLRSFAERRRQYQMPMNKKSSQ